MAEFTIRDEFYLDERPIRVISGAIHYFRVVPEYWRDRLEKLRLLGCNTVETYVPWNLHEQKEGQFEFSGRFDLRRFIQTAQDVGLYVILRPSPYICAEWEFGGLPSWLLKDPRMKVRTSYQPYLDKVARYFARLFLEFVDLQITNNGPIIMMQVENEYGSFGNDKNYLTAIADMMRENGCQVPLVTSDGPWGDMLTNGTLPDVFPTINCGSNIKEYFNVLREFHGKKRPLMVMEFWLGWFDAWGDEAHHTTETASAAKELADALKEGSVNLYMFHGGTNFGFNNGANYYDKLTPDTTSYDYDAVLTEWGDITPKYEALKAIIKEQVTLPQFELSTKIRKKAYGKKNVQAKVSLFAALADLSQPIHLPYTVAMEELDQAVGYIYYRSHIGKAREIADFYLVDCMDRAQVFVNEELILTQFDRELGEKASFTLTQTENELGILVENLGRVNYSQKLNHQRKGICDGVLVNNAFQSEWDIYTLPLDNLEQLDFEKDYHSGQPAFYRFELEAAELGDTFLDLTDWGKGFVTVNGFNIGRFWDIGPQKRLYIPAPLLQKGNNEIIVFESEGRVAESITFTDQPDLG